MCAVSVILDYWSARPDTPWTRGTFDAFKKIIDDVNQLDDALSQPDCHDPAKAAWMDSVEKRLGEGLNTTSD